MKSFSSDFHELSFIPSIYEFENVMSCSQRLEYSENGNFHIWKTKTKKKSNQSITVKDVTYFHGCLFYSRI